MENRKTIIDVGLDTAEEVTALRQLDKELLVLRLGFGKLKATIADAVAPVGAVLIPVVNKAVFALTGLMRKLAQVTGALFGMGSAQTTVTKSAAKTAAAIKRSVAGFDQLQRLDGSGGSGGTQAETETVVRQTQALTPELAATVQKIMELLEPLRTIDFLPLQWGLARVSESFQTLGAQISQSLGWVWFELLTPFAAWVSEKLAPVFLYDLKGALELVTEVLAPLGEGFDKLWQSLTPVTDFIGDTVLVLLDQMRRLFVNLSDTLGEKHEKIVSVFENVGQVISELWQKVEPVLTQLRTRWALTFEDMGEEVSRIAGFLVDALYGVTEFIAGVFTGDWERAWSGLGEVLKGCLNGIIGFINLLLRGVTGGLNSVIDMVNKLKFTVPDWVPGIGGETFGFNLKAVTAPQIPYLAKGAVLPANKPFLAVVGDQTHGTNVEAPLATIQEAVAVTMEEFAQSNLAGHQATVGVLRQILEAVLGIHIGDAELYRAVERYREKRAVMYGSGW